MSKQYQFKISEGVLKIFFPEYRVKEKTSIIQILLEATRYMLSNEFSSKVYEPNKLVLVIDKMSRLFFVTKDKMYSIVFPFTVSEYDKYLSFSFPEIIDVDAQVISNVITVLRDDLFNSKCSVDFSEPIYAMENDFNENFWLLLKELLISEDGYIRYDKDQKGYDEAVKKGFKHRHPINHFDIFYTSKSTFKVGFDKDIFIDEFIDSVNINTDCKFLRPAIK